MKKQKSAIKLLEQLQSLLDEIALLGPDQFERVKVAQARAKRIVRRLKADYPDLKMALRNPESPAVRRGPHSPDLGA